ncbi:MAG TPA: DUF1028 domain-containing protein [Pirellulales bacterium]|jgi:uncharacterized Ntn-hydrolase superfamily protein|nr:DUF1028 domain-containing protein [Pirellulales bacterium]
MPCIIERRLSALSLCVCLLVGGCGRTEPASAPRPARRDIARHQAFISDAAGFGVSGTFSIVAADPDTGICGAAVASKFPAVGSVVPFVRGGVGAFCTQHYHNPPWGPPALKLLEAGKLPEEVLLELLRDDAQAGQRQLAVIDRQGRTANHNPTQAPPDSLWWGSMSGRFYACQGNTLTGSDVVTAMALAFENTKGSLADRLMAALVAGDCAGGDHRGRLAAAILVAKPGIEGNWLDERIDKSDDAVLELARKYVELEHDAKGEWSADKRPWKHPCPDRPTPKPPDR